MESMNEKVCVVLGLALVLEKWITDGVGVASQWLFLDGIIDSISTLERQNKETPAMDELCVCKDLQRPEWYN